MAVSESHTQPHASLERILDAATNLFAEHGFDGVSTRQIARETGLNIATINHHAGGKRDLYLRVIERFFDQEETMLGALLGDIDEDALADRNQFRDTVNALIANVVQLAHANPQRQRLYARRWLDAPDELRTREAELTLRLYRALADLLRRGQQSGTVREGVDLECFLRSFDWMVMGYFTSGAFDWETLRADPHDPDNLERFKLFLQDYAARMLGLAAT